MKRAVGFLVWAFFALFMVVVSAMWARSELIGYDVAWFWVRPDWRMVINSHRGTLFLYVKAIEGGDLQAGWVSGQDRSGYWSLETTSKVVEWDYPTFTHCMAGVSWGTEEFLADAPTCLTGIGIPYWVLLLASCLGAFFHLALHMRRRARRVIEQPVADQSLPHNHAAKLTGGLSKRLPHGS